MLKKLFSLSLLMFAVLSLSYGQQAFHKTDKALNLGIGLGSGYYSSLNNLVAIPSFNASFETGVYEIPDVGVITAGGFLGFRHTWNNSYGYRVTYNNTVVAARGAFHLSMLNTSKFDVYGGIVSGFRISSYNSNIPGYVGDNDVYFVHDLFVGGRIMMSKTFGFFAEVGYGISYLKAGVTLKF